MKKVFKRGRNSWTRTGFAAKEIIETENERNSIETVMTCREDNEIVADSKGGKAFRNLKTK
jgi:hypothetical protein